MVTHVEITQKGRWFCYPKQLNSDAYVCDDGWGVGELHVNVQFCFVLACDFVVGLWLMRRGLVEREGAERGRGGLCQSCTV